MSAGILFRSFMVFLIASCETFRPYYVVYQAQIADPSQLAGVEVRVRNVGARWNLGIAENSFDNFRGHSLSMRLYFGDRKVLNVSNHEYGLVLTATDGSGMPLEDLERLIQEVLGELKALGLEFKLQESS